MEELSNKKVIIFGIGGVGSWCAESLARSGITDITIVDSDRVSITNVNRQIQATTKTVGEVKTDALKARLLEINPNAKITALQKIYCKDNWDEFKLDQYDYIVDAIDSLGSKMHLMQTATKTDAMFISSMGAALKIDPTRIKVDSFWKVKGCPLARRLRKKMRKDEMPSRDFLCVYSDELLDNIESDSDYPDEPKPVWSESAPGNPELANHDWSDKKAAINGSLVHITAIFGLTISGLIMKSVFDKE